MDTSPITKDMAQELKSWKLKTGWGYTAICKRIKAQGLDAPHAESLAAWEGRANKTLSLPHYVIVIDAYAALPVDLYNAPKGAKKKGYIAVSDDILHAALSLGRRKISNKTLLTHYNAPKTLNVQRFSSIIHGRAASIHEEHAQWIIDTHLHFENNQ
jgi:hypothetical protein